MAKPRASKPRPGVRINLPLREDLHRKLERAAAGHHFTLTNEIRIRLEDSFDRDTQRGYEEIFHDLEICWRRFSARFLRMSLADELADAVAKGEDQTKIRTLAGLIIKHRADEQRPSSLAGMP
jgi:hypothetical protein